MQPLWFLLTVVTVVVADGDKICSLTGDPHVTTFDGQRFLLNFPCTYVAAHICLQDENQGCKAELLIQALNNITNGRGNTFVSDVEVFAAARNGNDQWFRGGFRVNANNIQNETTYDDATDLLCILAANDGTELNVSVRNGSGQCVPVLSFRSQASGGGKPGLVITMRDGVNSTAHNLKPVCNMSTFLNQSTDLTEQQHILYHLLHRMAGQTNVHCSIAGGYFAFCGEVNRILAVQKCGQYTTSQYVACFKQHGKSSAEEVLHYCVQYYCGIPVEELEAKTWLDGLDFPQKCPVTFDKK